MTASYAGIVPAIERMPYPLAHLYREMLNEPDPRLRFRSLIKVFVGGLKYLSLICIADYMKRPDSNVLNESLSISLSRASAGHWRAFFRDIVAHYARERRQFHVRELADVLTSDTSRLLDYFVQVRNTYVHPDIWPSIEESTALYNDALPLLDKLLRAFAFIAEYPLVRIAFPDGEESHAMGDALTAPAENLSYRFVVRAGDGADLDLTAFLLITIDKSFRDLMVYETLMGQSAKYIMGNRMTFVTLGDEPDNRVKLLLDIIARCTTDEQKRKRRDRRHARAEIRASLDAELPMHMLRKIARGHSEEIFDEYIVAGRYDEQTYVPRTAIRAAYDRLESNGRALVIVADSGVGKSTEICHLYLDRFENDVTFIMSGRRVRAGSILRGLTVELIGEDAGPGIIDFLASFDRTRKNERFVILIDGVNETDKPADVIRELVELLETVRYDWLKIVVTCRSVVWSVISKSGLVIDKRLFVLSQAGEVAHVLKPFDDNELEQALERYSIVFGTHYPHRWADRHVYKERQLLRSPLILRFVFEAFRGKPEIPVFLDVQTIMREFTKERLRERDLPFLQRYLMAYFFHEETDVVDTRRLIAAQDETLDEKEEYAKLLDHICGEQVYETDHIWHCPKANCSFNEGPLFVAEGERTLRCPLCRSSLHEINVDNRSTYSRLLSENILSQSDCGDHTIVRLVFDRYFDHLMRRYCFIEKMHGSDDPAFMGELFRKAVRHGTFIEPLKGVLLDLWSAGDPGPLHRIASLGEFAAYHVLRIVFEEMATADFGAFAAGLRAVAVESGFNTNICRAGVHALLVDSDVAREHADEIVQLLILLSRCENEQVHEEAAQYVAELRREGVDMISPAVNGCADALLASINLGGMLRMIFTSERIRIRRLVTLFINILLYGLGSDTEEESIRRTIVTRGLEVAQTALRHPVLRLGRRQISRFVSRWFAGIYKKKGALPCNYWEMGFQLASDREAIIRTGDLFFLEHGNVFDLSYDDFQAAVHSENGLLSWMALSVLPLHYEHASDKASAAGYLMQLIREGTEMDRYVVGESAVILLRNGGEDAVEAERLLDAIGAEYDRDPSQIFLHPEPLPLAGDLGAVAATRRASETMREESDPYALPWIVRRDGALHRFYANTVAFHIIMLRMRRSSPPFIEDVLRLLERNETADLLRFGDDVAAGRRFVAVALLKALALAAMAGYLKECFATIARVIERYVDEGRDPENLVVYQAAVVESLKSMKEYHRDEVLAFVEPYELAEGRYAFLSAVKTAATAREKMLSKSLFGDKIYHEGFTVRALRESFGAATKRVARAQSVDELFFVYTQELMRWLRDYEA